MHKLFMTCTIGVIGLMIAASAPHRAHAMAIAAPASVGKVIHEVNRTQDVAYICRAGWEWRRCWGTPGPYWSYGYGYYRPYSNYRRPYPYSWLGGVWRQPWWWGW
jgi:hypothetical protein